jgi:hypothetical protein
MGKVIDKFRSLPYPEGWCPVCRRAGQDIPEMSSERICNNCWIAVMEREIKEQHKRWRDADGQSHRSVPKNSPGS